MPTPDGGDLLAQKQSVTIRRLNAQNHEPIHVLNMQDTGAVSLYGQGRPVSVQRTAMTLYRLSVLAAGFKDRPK